MNKKSKKTSRPNKIECTHDWIVTGRLVRNCKKCKIEQICGESEIEFYTIEKIKTMIAFMNRDGELSLAAAHRIINKLSVLQTMYPIILK